MHTIQRRIYYHDTDCGGVVYYANYLKYLEEARTEFFASRGLVYRDLVESGTWFVVARQEIDYLQPARYGDTLTVSTRYTDIGTVKLVAEHEITNQDSKPIARAKTTMVCVDSSIKPKAIPQDVARKLKEN